jgi:hypothetical protein
MTAENRSVLGKSPYTLQTIESAIVHLEQVFSANGSDWLFSQTYWHRRVLQALATRGLVPVQAQRLQRLLDRVQGPVPAKPAPAGQLRRAGTFPRTRTTLTSQDHIMS